MRRSTKKRNSSAAKCARRDGHGAWIPHRAPRHLAPRKHECRAIPGATRSRVPWLIRIERCAAKTLVRRPAGIRQDGWMVLSATGDRACRADSRAWRLPRSWKRWRGRPWRGGRVSSCLGWFEAGRAAYAVRAAEANKEGVSTKEGVENGGICVRFEVACVRDAAQVRGDDSRAIEGVGSHNDLHQLKRRRSAREQPAAWKRLRSFGKTATPAVRDDAGSVETGCAPRPHAGLVRAFALYGIECKGRNLTTADRGLSLRPGEWQSLLVGSVHSASIDTSWQPTLTFRAPETLGKPLQLRAESRCDPRLFAGTCPI